MKMVRLFLYVCAAMIASAQNANAFNTYMDTVNTACGATAVEGCASCHDGGKCSSDSGQCSENQMAYLSGDYCASFCPDSDVCPNGVTSEPDDNTLLAEARGAVAAFGAELKAKFMEAMQNGGPVNAISVCTEVAPAIASKISRETGWMVRRVTLRERNPLAIPDGWELDALNDFERAFAKGAPVSTLESYQKRNEEDRQYFRYISAIEAAGVCMACHGNWETLDPAIQTILQENYPHDRATGYSAGDIRGAFSVKRRIK